MANSRYVRGLDQAKAANQKVVRKVNHATAGVMYRMQTEVITASKTVPPTIPVDTGDLRSSATVELPVITPTRISVVSGVGGGAQDYAEIQHENADFKHDGEGEGAFFLSTPFARICGNPAPRIAREVAAELGL